MTWTTLTSKGQVTIPVDIRTKLGLRQGSRLSFVPTPSGRYEIQVEGVSVRDLKGAVAPPCEPVSLQDMDEAIVAGATASAP